MTNYIESESGRLMAIALGLVIGAGAASGLLGAPEALWVWTFMIFTGVVAGAASVMLGLGEHPIPTLFAVLVLPLVGLTYIIGLPVLLAMFPAAAYVHAVVAAGAFTVALRPARHECPSAHAHSTHAHSTTAHSAGH